MSVPEHLQKAWVFLQDTQLCVAHGRYDSVASRACYVLFRPAIGLLEHYGDVVSVGTTDGPNRFCGGNHTGDILLHDSVGDLPSHVLRQGTSACSRPNTTTDKPLSLPFLVSLGPPKHLSGLRPQRERYFVQLLSHDRVGVIFTCAALGENGKVS